jgi:hypothetical protein
MIVKQLRLANVRVFHEAEFNFGSSVIPVEATRYSVAKKKQKSDNH